MQVDTVIIKMNDTRNPMLMYKHTSTGRKTQFDQGVGGEKKHPEDGKKRKPGMVCIYTVLLVMVVVT